MSILGKRKFNRPQKTQTKQLKVSDESEALSGKYSILRLEIEFSNNESLEIGNGLFINKIYSIDPFLVHFDNDGDTIAQLAKQIKTKEWNQKAWTCPVLDMVAAHSLKPIESAKPIKSLETVFLKSKVREQWSSLQKKLTPLQSHLYSYIYEYKDILYGSLHHDNVEEIRNIYCLHAVNHCLK